MYLIGKGDLVVQSRSELVALRYRNGAVLVPGASAGKEHIFRVSAENSLYTNCFGAGIHWLRVDGDASINIDGKIQAIEISDDFKKGDLVSWDGYGYGVVKKSNYAWFNWEGNKIHEGSFQKRMSKTIGETINYNFAFYCRAEIFLVSMIDDSEVWSCSFSEGNVPGGIKAVIPHTSRNIFIVYYQDQGGVKKIYKLDLASFQKELLQQIDGYLWLDSFRSSEEYVSFMDASTIFKVNINNPHDQKKFVLGESGSIQRISYTANYMVVLIQDSSELVIIDRKHFEIKIRIILDIEGMKAVDLQGSDIGVAVKFKNIDDLPAEPCWVEYFSEEDLSKGVADIKAKEPENWQVEKQEVGNEGKFNLLLTINKGMSGADFLRHTSHALWATEFKYATHQNQFDKNEFRLGDKNFDGKLTLDLSAYKNLDELEEKALNRILEDAKNSMEGWGPAQPRLWVDVDTDDERPIKIEIIR